MKTGAAKRYYGIFAACVSFSFMIFVSCWQNENRIVKAEAQSGQSFAATERTDIMDEESETTHADSGISESVTSQMVSDMSFEQVQKLMDEMLGNNSFSIGTALENMINGKSVVSKEAVQQFLRSLFFDRIEKERENFFRDRKSVV